ncbi:MAG: MlaE family lipid ABC transporter permease subunit [Deltaproteobacteria bacterium]|nr:MlaE family lipid ABC transporter permease subunit [Deltaproteobacteria bacterium]
MADAADYELSAEQRNGAATIAIRGRVAVGNAQRLLTDITRALPPRARDVHLDLSGVEYFDSGGGAVLIQLRRQLAAQGGALTIDRSTPDIDGLLGLIDDEAIEHGAPPEEAAEPFIDRAGTWGLDALASARRFVAFTGEVLLGLLDAARHPAKMRWRDVWLYMQRAGYEALPIVSLISFLMGLITAFQAATQLSQFGADIYVANLVGLSITRELGPLMTAIIAAGRSGAAYAAEIGTMKVNEEVDALEAMGLDRTRFLITPKVVALVVMLPLLTLFADLVGILGGLFVAVFKLDLPAVVYFRQMRLYMVPWDIGQGLVKALVFAVLIATIGCLRGLEARESAESVGRTTTSAIVAGIFAIICADAVFTVLFNVW